MNSAPRAARRARRPLRVAAYDFGMKWNILRRFTAYGCDVRVYPATAPASELVGVEPGRRVPEQRSRRPGGSRLRHPERARPGEIGRAGIRDLPRPPDSLARDGRVDLQAQVRSSRREPSGEGAGQRQGGDHVAESRLRRRSRIRCRRTSGSRTSICTTGRSKGCVTKPSRCSACSTIRKRRRDLTTPTICSGSFSTRWKSERNAQADRHQTRARHRLRPDRDRPGLRVRLLRHTGVQGASRRGARSRARQQQSGDDHDRSGDCGSDLRRAADAGDPREGSSSASVRTRCCRQSAARPRSTWRSRWRSRARSRGTASS